MTRLVNATELARELGMTPQAVHKLRREGRISYQDARQRKFDVEVAVRQYQATQTHLRASRPAATHDELLEARILRERAEAALAQIKLRQAEGELVEAAGVNRAAIEYGVRIRDMLMAMPGRVAATVQAAPTAAEAERLLLDEVRAMCATAASWRPSFGRAGTSTTTPTPGENQ